MGTGQCARLQRLCDIRAGSRLSRKVHCAHLGRVPGAHRHHSRSHLRRRRCRCVEQRRVRPAPTRLHGCGRASARAHFTRAGRLRRPSPKSKASRRSTLRQCVRCGEWSIHGRPLGCAGRGRSRLAAAGGLWLSDSRVAFADVVGTALHRSALGPSCWDRQERAGLAQGIEQVAAAVGAVRPCMRWARVAVERRSLSCTLLHKCGRC